MRAAIVCACAASPLALLPSVDPDLLDQDRSSCGSNIEAKPDGRVTPGYCDDCHGGYFRTAASHRDAVASRGLLACRCDWTDVPVVDLRVQGVQVPMFLWDAERGLEVVATVGNQRGEARVSLWNPQTGALLDEIPLGTDAELKMNAISPDQKHIAAADITGTLWVVDLASREIRSIETTHTERIDGMNFSTDAKRLVTVGWDKTIKLWELATGDLICEKPAASPLRCAAIDPKGRFVATAEAAGSSDSTNQSKFRIWSMNNLTLVKELQTPDMYARSVAFSHDGKQLAGAGDRRLAIWSTDDWEQQQTRATGDRHIRAVCFHPSKSQLLIGSESGLVQWDLDSNKTLQMAGPAPSQIYWANYSAEGQHAAYYFGLTIAIQDLSQPHQSGYAVPLSGASDYLVLTAEFNRSGSRLAAAGTNRVIMIWKRGAFRPEIALHGHHGSILNVIWDSEDRLFSLDDNGKLLGWTAGHVHAWTTHVDAAPSYSRMHVLADIPDRDKIAVGTSDQGVLIVDSISGEINRRIDVDLAVQAVACDASGQWLAWCNSAGQLTVMNLETKKVVVKHTISDSDVRAIAFSPDSRSIAVAGKRMTWLYDIDANAIRWLRPNGAPVWGVAFSRSGRRLIVSTSTRFDYAHVIDVDDGEQVDRIPSGEMFDVAHDPTDDTVVLYGYKGRICRFEVGGTETTAARLVPPNAMPIKIPYKMQRESRGYSLSGQRGNEDRALTLAEEALELVPGCPEYRLTKAMALHRSGHYDDALEQLRELDGIGWNTVSRDDFDPSGLTVLRQIFLALTLNALDRQDEAKASLETAREMVESTFSSDGLVNGVFNEAVNSINKLLTALSKAAD